MLKRTFLEVAGVTTLAPLLPGLGHNSPPPTIEHNGKPYPVTQGWHDENTVRWPTLALMGREELDRWRWMLLDKSNYVRLTDDEEAWLRAITNHYNVRNALMVFAGCDHTTFGFEGVDQIHGGRAKFECGCELNVCFDHHQRHDPNVVQIPHTPRFVCEGHSHLRHDLAVLHERVHADHVGQA